MAATSVGAQAINGTATPSPAEEDEFYNQLLRLCDTVVQGKHSDLKLSPAAIERLRTSLTALSAPATVNASASVTRPATESNFANGKAFAANAATNDAQQSSAAAGPTCVGLPGLNASQSSSFVTSAAPVALSKPTPGGLDPIFLEKSDSLVRAEGQLKRQRIERDLFAQVEQRKGLTKERDLSTDAPLLDIDAILVSSTAKEAHLSGLKPVRMGSASSFDTNDYYSSQVQSDWSSEDSAKKKAGSAVDFDSLGMSSAQSSFTQSSVPGKQTAVAHGAQGSKNAVDIYAAQLKDAYTIDDDDDDDEYTPPDVTAFGDFGVTGRDAVSEEGQIDEDEDDEYEPGEVTQESLLPGAYHAAPHPVDTSPKVPVIRNHLTHIAAPQPNRVSPLAVAKGPSLELELVNGRPEVVQPKGRPQQHTSNNAGASRASTASPVHGGAGSNKKRRQKKRKRENELQQLGGRAKKKRDGPGAAHSPQPTYNDHRIKDEPVSPPPSFANIPEAQPYMPRAHQHRPAEIDLVSPRSVQYVSDPLRSSGLRYEYAQPSPPAIVHAASPAGHRPVQRDTQDLRRVASMHFAQRPPSPGQRAYSPAPQRISSMTYGRPPAEVCYQEPVQYVRERSPPRFQEYQDPYGPSAQSPALMPPPAASAAQRIVVDQYGRQYYAAEPQPAPAPLSRTSVAAVDMRGQTEPGHDRAASRMAAPYSQLAPVAVQYGHPDSRVAQPPGQSVQYVDANGYPVRDYSARPPVEQVRYPEAPTSPSYQQSAASRYDMAPPPLPAAREPTSPVYAPTRSYSVRPEDAMAPPTAYVRQATVAPPQYMPQPPPARAMSVAPGYEQSRAQSYAPRAHVQYVDQYGRPVYPNEVRQAPAAEYRYQ